MPLWVVPLLGAVTLSLQTQRTSLDLLDSLPVALIVHNGGSTLQTVRFPQPVEYAIEIRRDGKTLWNSLPPSPPPSVVFPTHARVFNAGTTTLTVYDWNELASDGSSLQPGRYTIVARLLSEKPQPEATLPVTFAAPLSPSALSGLKSGDVVTMAGTLDNDRLVLSDDHGQATLSRRLLGAPIGERVAVRGYAVTRPDGSHVFFVLRWAPLP